MKPTPKSSVRACLSATVAYYRHWAFPLSVFSLLPLTVGRSLRLWQRFAPNGDDPMARAAADAHFLTVLSIIKIGVSVPARILVPMGSLLLPPLIAIHSSIRMARRHGAQVRRDQGLAISTQLLEQMAMYMENPPLILLSEDRDWYYRKRLYLPALNDKRNRSMPSIGSLLGIANFAWRKARRGRGRDTRAARFVDAMRSATKSSLWRAEIEDKDFQRQRLQAASIPTLQVIGRFGIGKAEFEEGFAADRLPETGLFAKPRRNMQGHGAMAWRHVGPNQWIKEGDTDVQSGQQIVEYLTGQQEGYLLQPRIANHPDLLDLTGNTLCSVRVLTYMDASTGAARVFPWAWMKIPRAGAIVDNIHAKHPPGVGPGLVAAVDFDTGALGPAFASDLSWWTHHPDRGSAIQGRVLPGWDQLLAVAEAAQRAFMPDELAAGWDLAPTPTGWVVLEGNSTPGFYEEFFEGKLFGEDVEDVRRLIDLCLMALGEGR
jgi:hypothetical protein